MHLHQLLWHAAACGLGWLLFRRLASSATAAGAAALGFSLTHLHLSAAAWLAHRNAVLVLVFGLACLLAHDRWRRDGWRPGVLLGPLALAAALLSGELGVAVLGFLFAHALTFERATVVRRLAALTPYLIVLLGWRLVYDALGYGAVGSGVYIDPLAEPLAWLTAMPRRLVELLVYLLGPPGKIGALLSWRALGALVVVAALVAAARSGGSASRRSLAFAGVGVLLSSLPLTTTNAHDRMLVLATVGSSLAFGELIELALVRTERLPRLGALLVLLTHYLISPAAGVWLAFAVDDFKVSSSNYPIAAELDDTLLRRQSLVVLHAPDLLLASLLPASRQARGLNRPNFVWVLHAEPSDELSVRSIDARTLELHDPRGWLRGPDSKLLRGPGEPFAEGDEVRTLDFVLTVLEVEDGRPVRVAVRFRAPLGGDAFSVVSWSGDDFRLCRGPVADCR